MRLVLIAALCLSACGPLPPFPNNWSPNYTAYKFEATGYTQNGVAIDDPRGELDPAFLDRVIRDTLSCLKVSATLPPEFGVKIAPDWYTSQCSGAQVFPCNIGPEGCWAKGQSPTTECPCRCRAVVQDNRYIVTAPNLVVLPGRLVALITGAENPWSDPQLAPCASLRQSSLP